MRIFERTFAIASKMINDIEKILHWTIIVVQLLFFVFYGYSIYANLDRTIFLVIYSILALIGAINFITYLVTYHKSNKTINRFKRFLRVFKYISNGTMLIINTIELIKYGANDFSKVLLIASGLLLSIQVIIEFIRVFTERYINLFTTAIKMDASPFLKISKLKEIKGNFFELVDAPFEALANKLEGNKTNNISATEEYVNQITEESKKKKKEKTRQNIKENAKKQKQELNEHIGIIKKHLFKRKDKVTVSSNNK